MSPQKKKRKQFFRKWHRRIGFTISIFIFNLAVTGLLLNHYESFSLHTKHIKSSIILDWYNIKYPKNIYCLNFNDEKLCQLDDLLYLIDSSNQMTEINNANLNSNIGKLIDVIHIENEIYIISSNMVLLFNTQYQLIDSINVLEDYSLSLVTSHSSKQQIKLQGYANNASELLLFKLDREAFEITKMMSDNSSVNPQSSIPLTLLTDNNVIKKIGALYRQKQITYLKLIQDLHSGQIIFIQGKLFTDFVAILMIMLAISGFITWNRRKKTS